MRTVTGPHARSIAAASLALVLLTSLPASAGEPPPSTKYYPSTCGTATLQLCIDLAVSGDTILIDTDTPIVESLTIGKRLTLGAAPTFEPTIDGDIGYGAMFGNLVVTIQDLTVHGSVSGTITGGSLHAITIQRLHVTAPASAAGISFQTNEGGTFTFRSNTVVGSTGGVPAIRLDLLHDGGSAEAAIVGNRVDADGVAGSGAGIYLRAWGDGVTHAAVTNNAVWRVAKAQDEDAAGIIVRLRSTLEVDVDVVGNTVVRSRDDGLRVVDELTETGVATVDVFDNVFARIGASGVDVEGPLAGDLTVRAGHNAFTAIAVANQWNGFDAGVTFSVMEPRFVDEVTGDLRLRSTSPLVDLGVVCSTGGVVNLDAAEHGRLAGPTVDVGAYERGAGGPTGIVFMGTAGGESVPGTAGADIKCGLGGGDALVGGGGRDYIHGGAGDDVVLNGQDGPDRVFGGTGDDVCLYGIDGIGGNDRLDGGPGTDGAEADPGDLLVRTEGPPEVCSD